MDVNAVISAFCTGRWRHLASFTTCICSQLCYTNMQQVGHGTNVHGVISAPRNGIGVVGIIPSGAEMYTVRIWDANADVAYGEGPYASDLVLAYTQCEGRLRSRQAQNPSKQYCMVINLSLGAPGPLTVERQWFEGAAKSGDMLFVGAAGNNGTDAEQWSLYPASFPQVGSGWVP